MGTGFGEHAEIHCLKRANPTRVAVSEMWVAARRKKSGNPVLALPCAACMPAAMRCSRIIYRKNDGMYIPLNGASFDGKA